MTRVIRYDGRLLDGRRGRWLTCCVDCRQRIGDEHLTTCPRHRPDPEVTAE